VEVCLDNSIACPRSSSEMSLFVLLLRLELSRQCFDKWDIDVQDLDQSMHQAGLDWIKVTKA
jgi:hypothetical protein